MIVSRAIGGAVLALMLGTLVAPAIPLSAGHHHSAFCGCAPTQCRCDHGGQRVATTTPSCHRAQEIAPPVFVRCGSSQDFAFPSGGVPAVLAHGSSPSALVVVEPALFENAPRPSSAAAEILTPPS